MITKIFLLNATTSVKLNDALFEIFNIIRGVCERCLLTPYFFFIITKVMNFMLKACVMVRLVKRICLHVLDQQ